MSAESTIEFVLKDREEGVDITPSNIGLSRFNEFNQQVQEFLAGTERLKLDEVHVSIEQGSYKLITFLPLFVLSAIQTDLQNLQRQDSLGEIDPKRADILAKWQARSKNSENLSYSIQAHGLSVSPINVSRTTDFRIGEIIPWVRVEKYLFGTIVDMGGVQKANVHLRLDDSNQLVRVSSDQSYLMEQQNNRLYRKALVRVEAEQHYKSGDLRNYKLLSFEDYDSTYNESALEQFISNGTQAWSDIPDAAKWVRELRGGIS